MSSQAVIPTKISPRPDVERPASPSPLAQQYCRGFDDLRAEMDNAWRTYIELGIRFFALPIDDLINSGHLNTRAFEVTVDAFSESSHPDAFDAPEFMYQFSKTAHGLMYKCGKAIAEGRVLALQIVPPRIEQRVSLHLGDLARLEWAVEEMIAVRNMTRADDARGTRDESVNQDFEVWAFQVQEFVDIPSDGEIGYWN